MNTNASNSINSLLRVITITALLLTLLSSVYAQSSTDGQTPLGLQPGSPVGSYPLSDFENVNLFNGNLNFSLPLLKIGGRGGAGFNLTLRVNQKWTVHKEIDPGHPAHYLAKSEWWTNEDGGIHSLDAGRVSIRRGHTDEYDLGCGVYRYRKTLTRITFTAPDGTEYELRDQSTGGQPVGTQACGVAFNRGTDFVTADGTSATFISDNDILDIYSTYEEGVYYQANGYFLLRDGTKFRVEDGLIKWMRDRNGNKVTFTYDPYRRATGIVDSLNRQVSISYNNPSTGTTKYDEVTYKGFGGAARTIRIGHALRAETLRSDVVDGALFPDLNNGGSGYFYVVNYIELPDSRRYNLQYSKYGEIARIVLPTGGAIEYDWTNGLLDGSATGVFSIGTDKYVYRRVVERRVYPGGGSGSGYESRMTYSRPESISANAGYVIVDQYNVVGSLLGRSQHYFQGSARDSFGLKAVDYAAWQDSKEYKTETFDTNGSTILRRVETSFAQRAAVSWWTGTAAAAPPNDVRPTETVTTLVDSNQISKHTFGYDDSVPFNNQNNAKEYDFGNGSAGALLRETRTTYLTSSSYTDTSFHIRNLPLQVSVYDGSGSEKARSAAEYDNYTLDGANCDQAKSLSAGIEKQHQRFRLSFYLELHHQRKFNCRDSLPSLQRLSHWINNRILALRHCRQRG